MAPPKSRRRFRSLWDEANYLYDKFLHWYYLRGDRKNARPYARRLKALLSRAEAAEDSIFGRECLSLVAEFEGDLETAIRHREAEIALIERLRAISIGTPGERVALSSYGPDSLSDRLDLLAALLARAGDLEGAVRRLRRSERLCAEHGRTFRGREMLREYQAELAPGVGDGSPGRDGIGRATRTRA